MHVKSDGGVFPSLDRGRVHGNDNVAHAMLSKFVGDHNFISGVSNGIWGNYNTVSGLYHRVIGDGNTLYGHEFTVEGNGNIIHGNNSHVKGDGNHVYGDGCYVKGINNIVTGAQCVVNGIKVSYREIVSVPMSQESRNEDGEMYKCIVCLTELANCLVLPCAHLNLCVECARRLVIGPDHDKGLNAELEHGSAFVTCPSCRERMTKIIRVFPG